MNQENIRFLREDYLVLKNKSLIPPMESDFVICNIIQKHSIQYS